jgi:TolB protein
VNADGSGLRRLFRFPAGSGQVMGSDSLAWSPDGRTIAFNRDHRAGGASATAVYIMNSDGSGRHRLTLITGQKDPGGPTWSPDGRRIAFEQGVRPTPSASPYYIREEIYVINVDGSGQQWLAYGTHPLWSPNGEKIAFLRNGSVVGGLYVMNPDGTGRRRLGRDVPVGSGPAPVAWSPG